jgi:hypothetical protein
MQSLPFLITNTLLQSIIKAWYLEHEQLQRKGKAFQKKLLSITDCQRTIAEFQEGKSETE